MLLILIAKYGQLTLLLTLVVQLDLFVEVPLSSDQAYFVARAAEVGIVQPNKEVKDHAIRARASNRCHRPAVALSLEAVTKLDVLAHHVAHRHLVHKVLLVLFGAVAHAGAVLLYGEAEVLAEVLLDGGSDDVHLLTKQLRPAGSGHQQREE